MQYLRSICILFLVGLCGVSLAFSQAVSGSLVGTITDASGSVVANAQVTMTETNTGVSRTTKTGEAGNYVFADVPQGTYSVSVEVTGFKKAVRSGVDVLVNNLQFEGVDNNERTGLLQVLIPPIEALQTVDISTSNFEAELGRSTGAVTNIILKSGTNQIHAQGYWFNRVSALSARAFYDPVRGHFVYNYFGGQAGAPIIKNRTFIFFDFLRQTDHRYGVDRYTLPTDAERHGDISVATAPIYDPRTGNPDGTGRTPFPGNKIEPAAFCPFPTRSWDWFRCPICPG